MPFGAIYAALLFAATSIWLAGSAGAAAALAPAPRWLGAGLGAVLAVALLSRAGWARWAGAAFAAATVAAAFAAADGAEGPAPLALGLAAILALPLLVVPGTGRIRRPATRPMLAAAAALLATGAAAGIALTGAPAVGPTAGAGPTTGRTDAPNAAVGRPGWTGWSAALDRAAAESRPVFVAFVTSWCGYCDKMERVTWRDPEALASLGRFVPVRVDAESTRPEGGASGAELARRYEVAAYPTLLVVDARGRELARAGGYLPPRRFAAWLDDALARFEPPEPRPLRAAGSGS